ncbi:hypothetical protein [Sphingobacterium chungjuense]|uniref:hypothetical protein n=1 Tax=Sphingobacterium chungjuense TaxID=2675553 RepID=UPI00140E750F|nr:hypothetical protein [Sphingobacterium chungjuense]
MLEKYERVPALEQDKNPIELTSSIRNLFDSNIENIEKTKQSNSSISVVDLSLSSNYESLSMGDRSSRSLEGLSRKSNSAEIINVLVKEKVISEDDAKLFMAFSSQLSYSKEPLDVIKKYEQDFIKKGLYSQYESMFVALPYMAQEHPQILSITKRDDYRKSIGSSDGAQARFLTSCAGASVGLGLAFVGLVAGGTSVIGAGIGAAGFIYASAQWGASCR